MSKPFIVYPCMFLATLILLGCGNKGELFLPPDQQLTEELESASNRSQDAGPDITADAVEKKKRPANEPTQ